jgi:TolB-like protein
MKRNIVAFWAICLVPCLTVFSCTTLPETSGLLSLDGAINAVAKQLGTELAGRNVAVVAFGSPSDDLTDYVIDELSRALANSRSVMVVDRKELDLVREEQLFQLSGDVSDESARSIGKKLGADTVVSGSFMDVGNAYRFGVKALDVESASIESAPAFDITKKDPRLIHLLGGAAVKLESATVQPAQSPLGNRGIEWNENDGYAIVNGNNYHYWLYSIEAFCDYHHWDKKIIGQSTDDRLYTLRSALFKWVERQGWTIDYDNAWLSDPNNNLALSVKRLMASRGQGNNILDTNQKFTDVSATIVTENDKEAILIINYWNFMKEDYWKTWGYPLLKFK